MSIDHNLLKFIEEVMGKDWSVSIGQNYHNYESYFYLQTSFKISDKPTVEAVMDGIIEKFKKSPPFIRLEMELNEANAKVAELEKYKVFYDMQKQLKPGEEQ